MTATPAPAADGLRIESIRFRDCAARVRAFRNNQRAVARDADYFEWRYARKPLPVDAPEAFVTWIVDASARDVAAASVIPHRCLVNARAAIHGLLGDVSVHGDFQGRGLATRLIAAALAHAATQGYDGCIVLANQEVLGAMRRAGLEQVAVLERYVLLVDPAARLFPGQRALAWLARVAFLPWSWRLAREARRLAREGLVLRRHADVPPGAEDLWRGLALDRIVLAVRDAAALRWRFVDKPEGGYFFYSLEGRGGTAAWLIAHREDGWVVVDDLLGVDGVHGRKLLAAVADDVRLRRLGHSLQWRACGGDAPGQVVPHAPWSRRADGQPLLYKGFGTVAPAPGSIFVATPADKDV